MNPVYEGYFSQLRFYSQSGEADESEGGGEQERFMIPKGQWEISSRLPGAKYSYRVVQQDDSSSDCFLNTSTETANYKDGTWLREISSCCCLTTVGKTRQLLLHKIYIPFCHLCT